MGAANQGMVVLVSNGREGPRMHRSLIISRHGRLKRTHHGAMRIVLFHPEIEEMWDKVGTVG